MAIDNRDKRTSAMNHRCPWRRHRPLADFTIGQADRKHLARLYSGILENTGMLIGIWSNVIILTARTGPYELKARTGPITLTATTGPYQYAGHTGPIILTAETD